MSAPIDLIGFVADCLKFVAVPSAAFELLEVETRRHVDLWIERWSQRLLKISVITLGLIFVAVCLSLFVHHFVELVALVIVLFLVAAYVLRSFFAEEEGLILALAVAIAPIAIGAIIYQIIEPNALAGWSPYLWGESRVTGLLGLDGPLYRPDETLQQLRELKAENDRDFSAYDALSWWERIGKTQGIRVFYERGQEWVAHGLVMLIYALLNAGFIVLLALLPLLLLSGLFFLLYLLSNWLKGRLSLDVATRYPLSAAMLWALGEIIGFGLSTYKFLSD